MVQTDKQHYIGLPAAARLPINRCNLPADILGGLTFQQYPTALKIDGVRELHADFFDRLDKLLNPFVRAEHFMEYMNAYFSLDAPEYAGYEPHARINRSRATYLKLLRGWLFNPDGIEAAVLKGWVESRFGLIPRYHGQPIRHAEDEAYRQYEQDWAQGLYNTNALESQLDLTFSYCQYELSRRFPEQMHLTLYRGANHLSDYELMDTEQPANHEHIILLNNINSFSSSRDRADEFGDYIIEVDIPLSKILFFNHLLPNILSGEDEYVVIGGLYRVTSSA